MNHIARIIFRTHADFKHDRLIQGVQVHIKGLRRKRRQGHRLSDQLRHQGQLRGDVGDEVGEWQPDLGLQRGGGFQRHRHRLLIHDLHRDLITRQPVEFDSGKQWRGR